MPQALSVTAGTRVAAITEIYANASTYPCKVVTEAGGQWVMKLCGSGPGAMSLMTELLALRIAQSVGLSVPAAQPLYLPPGFPWMIGTDEFDGIVQRSYGWNLGIAYVDQARPAAPETIRAAEPAFLDALLDVDRALSNMDRTARNPNVLETPTGLIAIDFDACLFLRRAARAVVPASFPTPPGHLLEALGHPAIPCRIDPGVIAAALHDVPADWLDLIGSSVERLEDHLRAYIAAWNSQ